MKKKSLKRIKSSIRKKQLSDGFFDGRFVPRVEPDKKKMMNKNKCRIKIVLENI